MKTLTTFASALALSATGAAFADETAAEKARAAAIAASDAVPTTEPVQMTEAEMDNVAAGALINAVLVDVVDVQDVNVAIPVNAAVAAGILGAAGAAALQQPGRQR